MSGLLNNVKDLAGGTFQEVAGMKGQIGASMAQIVGNDAEIKGRLDKCESDLREVIAAAEKRLEEVHKSMDVNLRQNTAKEISRVDGLLRQEIRDAVLNRDIPYGGGGGKHAPEATADMREVIRIIDDRCAEVNRAFKDHLAKNEESQQNVLRAADVRTTNLERGFAKIDEYLKSDSHARQ